MANSQDPHRPFIGSKQEAAAKKRDKRNKSHQYGGGFPDDKIIYTPAEIPVPGFLPDLPNIRQELAEYYSSVHRADAITGAVLKALDEAGLRENTLVMFLSDHGMPLPFAKTNCWHHSTHTPWIIRWPGKVKAGSHDKKHVVGGVDLTPTVLDALGLPSFDGADGRSFLPVLAGEEQEERDFAFAHNEYDFSSLRVAFEVFRFEDGQAVEHWDNIQPKLGPNPSGRGMLDGATEIVDREKTEANRAFVRAFVDTVLVHRQLDKLEDFIAEDLI